MEMINDSTNSVFTEGEKILIRTVTHYQVGRVEEALMDYSSRVV
jgi:hypothetical protein